MQRTPDGYPRDAWQLFQGRLTPERQSMMERLSRARTFHVRLVLQDLHDFHNIAACLRSAEALGIGAVDVVDRKARFAKSGASRGASKWLRLTRWDDEALCAKALKADGYKILGAYPDQSAVSLGDIAIDQKVAVVFGNEHQGLSQEWLPWLDQRFTIPMHGMVESFNISVAAAITLFELRRRACQDLPAATFLLTEGERQDLLAAWACKNVPEYEGELARLRQSPSA